jgi:hypothetical protein
MLADTGNGKQSAFLAFPSVPSFLPFRSLFFDVNQFPPQYFFVCIFAAILFGRSFENFPSNSGTHQIDWVPISV